MELLILRHGETEWTMSGRHTGTTEIDLTDRGREEARAQAPALAELLDGSDPLVFVSPRIRTRHTIELALPDHDFGIEALLAEFDYGDYEGLTHDEIDATTPGWDIWSDGCPGGETASDVMRRADQFLESIGWVTSRRGHRPPPDRPDTGRPYDAAHDSERSEEHRPVVAVTHGHMSRALAMRALGLPITTASVFDSATASLSMITTVRGQHVLSLWNRTP